jgi:hypothetical protein
VVKTFDCRKKASEFLRAAQLSSDPDESLGWLQLSDAWLTLADQLDKRTSAKRNYSDTIASRPEGLVERRKLAEVKVADALRGRLTPKIADTPRKRTIKNVGDLLRQRLALDIDDIPRGPVARKVGDVLRQRLALKLEDAPRGQIALTVGEVLRHRLALTSVTNAETVGTTR